MALPTLHPLNRATGSARYTSPNSPHTILATINGPHELPKRSDEIPDNVFVDVHVRPAVGVSGVRERRLEEIVKKTVGSAEILRGREMMRLGIMVGLLVVGGREGGGGTQGKEVCSFLFSFPGFLVVLSWKGYANLDLFDVNSIFPSSRLSSTRRISRSSMPEFLCIRPSLRLSLHSQRIVQSPSPIRARQILNKRLRFMPLHSRREGI